MHSDNRKTWHWPDIIDAIWYSENQTIRQIEYPEPSGSRGQFKFADGTF